jgi:hypothetical protein
MNRAGCCAKSPDFEPYFKKKLVLEMNMIIVRNKKYFKVAQSRETLRSGDYPGAHAEIRALDDLARKKFGSTTVSNQVFDAWLKNDVLGYNRNIQYGVGQQNVIMNTCADCFHITDLVTFIKPQ